MFPERPQDYGRLAASAVGLGYAALGCSRPFYNLCEDIFTSIVIDRGITPNWKDLKWQKKAGMFEVLEQLKTSNFPAFERTLAAGFVEQDRSDSELQKNWRTESLRVRGEIVFINKL